MANLGFGMMRLPLLEEDNFANIDYEQVNQMVDAFMDAGFNHFDTAYIYHENLGEEAFKRCVVERYPRESFKLATKLPLFVITEESQLEPIFSEQLERCGVDYFDYYMGFSFKEYVEPKNYISKENAQISDEVELTNIIVGILDASLEQIEQYKAGKNNLFDYFVGQVMKNTRGKANPVMTKEIIQRELDKR